MNLCDFPSDILEQIFYIHVYEHLQSRVPLLRTCRSWRLVATNYSSLWRIISWHGDDTLPPNKVKCHSLNGLSTLINRTGTATFDFRLGCPYRDLSGEIQAFISSIPKDWLSRCHTFTLHAPEAQWRVPNSRALGDLLGAYSYEALDRLELIHTGSKMWEYMLENLMSRIESTSPNLRSLTVHCGRATKHVKKCVFDRPAVLGNIRNLDIRSFDHPVPWNDLPNLERLAFRDLEFKGLHLKNLIAPKLLRLTLEGDYLSSNFPKETCQQLTHLTLEYFAFENSEDVTFLRFSSLLSLIIRSGDVNFPNIEAPKLDEFVFVLNPSDESPYLYPEFDEVKLTPRIIRLDILSSEDQEEPLVYPLDSWSKVEELHLTTFGERNSIGPTLIETLTGTGSERFFPFLKCLTVLYPAKEDDGNPWPVKQSQIDELRGILNGRLAAGFKVLERMEVGWYWTGGNDSILDDPERRWWVTKWEDCLK